MILQYLFFAIFNLILCKASLDPNPSSSQEKKFGRSYSSSLKPIGSSTLSSSKDALYQLKVSIEKWQEQSENIADQLFAFNELIKGYKLKIASLESQLEDEKNLCKMKLIQVTRNCAINNKDITTAKPDENITDSEEELEPVPKPKPSPIDEEPKCGVVQVAEKNRLARIVGGNETVAGAFPWTASIRLKSLYGIHHCGASIISENYLITAAHCFDEISRPSSYKVVAGEHDFRSKEDSEQTLDVVRIYIHPDYEDYHEHDIAVLKVASPGFEWTDFVQPICMPTQMFNYTTGRKCAVSGWGRTEKSSSSRRLQSAFVPIIDRQKCKLSSINYRNLAQNAFCAGYMEGGVDSCKGDSGGPFACQVDSGAYALAGVISYGDGCGMWHRPGVYTKVASYLDWIYSIPGGR